MQMLQGITDNSCQSIFAWYAQSMTENTLQNEAQTEAQQREMLASTTAVGTSGEATQNRQSIIVRTSVIGIIANIVLAAFKAVVGLLANSIAVVLDAVNNFTDALSSVITILGAKLAGKKPDRKHPLGHGRYEYLSAMVITGIVGYAGITSFVESVKKIFEPTTPDFSTPALVIIASAVIVKIVLGRYTQSKGEQVNSGSLIASGKDALFDAIISAGVLVAAIIFLLTGVNLEAYVGVAISIIIIKAAVDMLRDTLDDVLGTRPPSELSRGIKDTVTSDPEVLGAYDLLIDQFGPDLTVAQVHVEVPDTTTAAHIDAMTRRLQDKVMKEHGVALATVGIYSHNTTNAALAEMRNEVTRMALNHEGVIQVHGFYADEETKQAKFDIVIDFDVDDRASLCQHVAEHAREIYPDYTFDVTLDRDLSD